MRRVSPAVGNLVRFEVARVRALFERARPLVDVVGSDLAVELALTWHGGMRILDKIEALDYDTLHSRPTIGTRDLPALAAATLRGTA